MLKVEYAWSKTIMWSWRGIVLDKMKKACKTYNHRSDSRKSICITANDGAFHCRLVWTEHLNLNLFFFWLNELRKSEVVRKNVRTASGFERISTYTYVVMWLHGGCVFIPYLFSLPNRIDWFSPVDHNDVLLCYTFSKEQYDEITPFSILFFLCNFTIQLRTWLSHWIWKKVFQSRFGVVSENRSWVRSRIRNKESETKLKLINQPPNASRNCTLTLLFFTRRPTHEFEKSGKSTMQYWRNYELRSICFGLKIKTKIWKKNKKKSSNSNPNLYIFVVEFESILVRISIYSALCAIQTPI